MSRPVVLIEIGAFWPGNDSSGPTLSVKALCQLLRDQFDFRIVARNAAMGSREELAGPGWHDLGYAQVCYLRVGKSGAEGLATLINDCRPDLMLLNGFFDREFTIPTMLARRFGRIADVPVILSPRGEFSGGALGIKSARKSAYLQALKLAGLASNVVFHTTSDAETRDVRARFPQQRIAQINNARPIFPLPVHVPRREGAPLRIAFVGRIALVKGIDTALRILAGVRHPVDFTIYGPVSEPAHWQHCQSIIATLPGHITAAHFGEIPNEAVAEQLARHDLMLLPSLSENFGHAIFEALSAGTPVVIGTQTPWRNLSADKSGFDLPLADIAAISAAIDGFAALPLREQMVWRNAARLRAELFVQGNGAAGEFAALFNELIATNRSSRATRKLPNAA